MTDPSLPKTEDEWISRALDYELDFTSSIHHGFGKLVSASEMPQAQFILLRVLWSRSKEPIDLKQKLSQILGNGIFGIVEQRLHHSGKEWREYLKHLPSIASRRGETVKDIGRFTHVRWSQLLLIEAREVKDADRNLALWDLTRGPRTRSGKYGVERFLDHPKFIATPVRGVVREDTMDDNSDNGGDYEEQSNIAKDEQLVTSFRKELIDQIQLTVFQNKYINHSIERKQFRLGRLFTAAVDGTDRFTHDPASIKAIYEDKRHKRDDALDEIRMQEAGEMACWISADAGHRPLGVTSVQYHNGRRVYSRILISLDHHEFWITVAEYDDRYISYLRHEAELDALVDEKNDRIFLEMKEYGPFDIYQRGLMEVFGECYIAIVEQWRRGYGGHPSGGNGGGDGRSPPTDQWRPYTKEERLQLLKLEKSRSESGRRKGEERRQEDLRRKKEARAKSRERREQGAAATAAAVNVARLKLDDHETPTRPR